MIRPWRPGDGQALMDCLLAQARLRGLDDITVGTIAKFDGALGFYAKNGYVQIPRNALRFGFPVMAPDDIFCRLDLTS
ncbi:GNAT family N-acetyltransferase [Asticcacaulis biprosthecium]|nr:GNAT family N-acetyltransferase [Asticcacaulis biprosthecium]